MNLTRRESAPATPPAGNNTQAWLIGGLGGCVILLLLLVGGFVAAVIIPAVSRYRAAVTIMEQQQAAPAPLPVAATPLPETNRDKTMRFIAMDDIRARFQAKDFAALEEYYRQELATRLDYDSRYNLTQLVLQLGLSKSGTESRLRAWVAAYPQSHLPHLLLGRWYIEQAWAARGDDWASTVTDSGWQGMRTYLAEADRELRLAYNLEPADPNIGAMGITVAMGQSSGAEDGWFARAMAADPCHTGAYQNLMNARFPKWGGTWESARAVVDEALAMTDDNPQLFALLPLWHEERVARAVDNSSSVRTDKRTAQREAYDGELRAAYAAAAAKYPTEYEIHMRYAFAASMNRERDVAMREFDLIIPLLESGQAMPMPCGEAYDGELQAYLNKYAWLLATSSDDRYYDPARALIYAQKAVDINPDWEWALDTLACAHAANGDFTRAIAAQREAQKHGSAGFQRHCETDIEKYQRGESPRH